MSTCPDSDLYSAYADGEVPSPWKEKLEAHIASCPKCKQQAERYARLRSLIASGIAARAPDFESSFARVSERRSRLIATMSQKQPIPYMSWTHISVRIPITALAAMFLAAVFLPAYFILKSGMGSKSAQPEFSMQQTGIPSSATSGYQRLKTLATANPVYSPDLSAKVMQTQSVPDTQRTVFTMVDYARQFAANQELFSDADIIIIKLPNLTHFSNLENDFQSTGEPLLKAAGYYK